MYDNQVFPRQGDFNKNGWFSRLKKILLATLAILLVIGVAGFSYFLGTKSKTPKNVLSTAPVEPKVTEMPTSTSLPEVKSASPSATTKVGPTKSPSITPTPVIKTRILAPIADLDGFRASDGGGNNLAEIKLGRSISSVSRGFVAFDLSSIAPSAKVTEATLKLYQAKIVGSPYASGGNLKVDHLTYGDSLDDSDYGMSALSSSFDNLSSNPTLEWKEVDVTEQLRNDLANARSVSQFRIHFQIENTGGNATGDFAYFESAENTLKSGNIPQLVISYF